MNELLNMAYDAAMQHIPHSELWKPQAGLALVGAFGLILLLRGARLFPAVTALAFMAGGGIAGGFLAKSLGTALSPTVVVTGVIGFGLGYFLFKLWLAALVGLSLAAVGLMLYGEKVVRPYVENFSSRNLDAGQGLMGINIPETPLATQAPSSWAAQSWDHLSTVVPNFQASFWAIVGSIGLAGLVLGLLLPKVSRALVAATLGTLLSCLALLLILKSKWPAALSELQRLGEWGWTIVALLWAVSLLYNFTSLRRKPRPAATSEEPETPEPATA
jgi:hypothetical protein